METFSTQDIYRTAWQNSPEGICYCRSVKANGLPEDIIFLDANASFTAITNIKILPGQRASEVFPDARTKILSILEDYQAMNADQLQGKKELYVLRTEKWFGYTIKNIDDHDFIVFAEDITERKRVKDNLLITNELLRQTLEATEDGILVSDLNSVILKFNTRFCELHEITPEQFSLLRGNELITFLLPKLKDPARFLENTEKIRRIPEKVHESIIEYKNGKTYHRLSRPLILNGEVAGKVLNVRDITELTNTYSNLGRALSKLNFHINNNPIAVIELDASLRLISWSKGAERIFGWSASEVIGKKYNEFRFSADENIEKENNNVEEIISQFKDKVPITSHYTKDGAVLYCKWHGSVIKDENGKTISILSIVENLTEEIRLQHEVEQAYSFNKQIVSNIRSGIIVLDTNLNVTVWNPFMEALTCIASENIVGKYIGILKDRITDDRVYASITDALEGRTGQIQTAHFGKAESDRIIYASSNFMPFTDPGGKIIGVIISVTDVTEMVLTQRKLADNVRSLSESNRQLEDYAYANKELTQFSYIAAHQLQTPVRTISNFIKIIREDFGNEINEKLSKYLDTIGEASGNMGLYVNALLQYSTIGRKKQLILSDLKTVIDQVINEIRYVIDSSGTTIEVGIMPEIPVYQVEFRQLIRNLLENAIKFQEKGSRPLVRINSKKRGTEWLFEVNDNGIGMDQEYSEKIFDIFQRLHNDEHEYAGLGIGLAYCKKIVEFHKGRIWAESSRGNGSTFCFSISEHLQ
jgi:PAS domain S-box-containing protein